MFEIAILNPRRPKARKSKGSAKVAKRRRKLTKKQIAAGFGGKKRRATKKRVVHRKRRRVVAKTVRRVKRRRSSGGVKHYRTGGYTIGNARIRRKKMNPRRRHHRNPISVRGITGQLMPAAYGAAGGIALDVGMGYLGGYLPSMLTTGYVKHVTRIGAALGIGYGAKKFLGAKGNAVAQGALIVAVYGLLKDVIVQFAPAVKGLGDYEEVTLDTSAMGAYLSGPALGAYLPDGSAAHGVGAYMDAAQTVGGVDY